MVQLSKDKLVTAYTQEGIEESLKLLTDTYLDFVDNDLLSLIHIFRIGLIPTVAVFRE